MKTKKIFAHLLLIVCGLLIACNKDSQNTSYYTTIEKQATHRLDSLLHAVLSEKASALNKEILYSSNEDSICVVKFDCVWERASGRITNEAAEYVYNARGLTNRDKDLIIDLSIEQSIIEDAKDFIDETEMEATPEGRKNLKGGWESVMKYVVPLRILKTNYQ